MLAIYGIIIYAVFNYTSIGYHVRTIGNNRQVAANIGVSIRRPPRSTSLQSALVILTLVRGILIATFGGASATSGMDSMSVSFDALMSVYMGMFLSRYCNLIVGVLLGTLSMKMFNAGLIAIGLSATL